MAFAHDVRYAYREYVAFEASSNVKHEFFDGRILAMAGGTPEHAALQAAIPALLFSALRRGPCLAYGADLRVRVLATGLATYPDATIVCGEREVDPDDRNAVVNPTLIVEVLSPNTEAYDRGEKFEHYKRVPSLRQYVLVATDERRVDVWTRSDDGTWRVDVCRDGDVATLSAASATLSVRELYDVARVTIPR